MTGILDLLYTETQRSLIHIRALFPAWDSAPHGGNCLLHAGKRSAVISVSDSIRRTSIFHEFKLLPQLGAIIENPCRVVQKMLSLSKDVDSGM